MRFSSMCLACMGVLLATADLQAQTVWYVNDNGASSAGCTSWVDACPELQKALSLADPGDQIWVATGIYKPDYNVIGGVHTGDRTLSFALVSAVGVYGGFAGTETSFAMRAGLFDQTILSGDLAGNDGPGFTNNGENSLHVVSALLGNASTVLDGFRITGGNASLAFPDNGGGGMVITNNQVQVRNCRFVGNAATGVAGFGGGLSISPLSAPTISYCTFESNLAVGSGGGVGISGNVGQVTIPILRNCKILGNSAGSGGGIANSDVNPVLVNCLLAGNTATNNGGAMRNTGSSGSSPSLINCAVVDNVAGVAGGGIANTTGAANHPVVTNTVLWANSDAGGMDESAQIHTTSGSPVVNYSCIQGLSALGGTGNIGSDPLFVDADGADDNPATAGDNNYRLAAGSPAIDAGQNAALPVCMVDLDDNERIVDDPATADTGDGTPPVDMGPYEFGSTAFAGSDCDSNAREDACELAEGAANDCNGNSIPDRCDITSGAGTDCGGNGVLDECEPDCNNNMQADECDIASGSSQDCTGDGIPDECEPDCNDNDIVDSCEIKSKLSPDCNGNGVPDECDISSGSSQDNNSDGIPDDCPMLIAFDETTPLAESMGLRICRVYVQFDNSKDSLLSIGFSGINTDDPAGFHQSDFGGDTAPLQTIVDLVPETVLDSYVTIGVATDDGTDSTITDPSWNTCAFNCDPAPPCVPGGLALPGTCGQAVGGWLNSDPDNSQGVPDENFRVLIGQFTVNDGFGISGSRAIFINDGLIEFPGIFNCFECTLASECDDGNACTTDECLSGACINTTLPNGASCVGNGVGSCTAADTCQGGVCLNNNLPQGTPCTSDGNQCTSDFCNASGVCTHPGVALGTPCDADGDLCTIDLCGFGASCTFNNNVECGAGQECVNGICESSCPADLNNDGIVNAADLAALLGAWGPCD